MMETDFDFTYELEEARKIQTGMLPESVPELQGFPTADFMNSNKERASRSDKLLIGWASKDITPTKAVALAGQFHVRISKKVPYEKMCLSNTS